MAQAGIVLPSFYLVRPDGYVGLTMGGNNPQPVWDYLGQMIGH